MKRILVLSDVHGNLKLMKNILNNETYDYVIYAGDLQHSDESILRNIDFKVVGNMDYNNIDLPENVSFEIDGHKFFLTHGHLYGSLTKKIDFDKLIYTAKSVTGVGEDEKVIIIHGHDHISDLIEEDDYVRFNPGSTTEPRNTTEGTYGIITIEGSAIKLEHKNV